MRLVRQPRSSNRMGGQLLAVSIATSWILPVIHKHLVDNQPAHPTSSGSISSQTAAMDYLSKINHLPITNLKAPSLQAHNGTAISFSRIRAILYIAIAATLVYQVARAIYRYYFHPLRRFPGPRIAAVSDVFPLLLALSPNLLVLTLVSRSGLPTSQ